MKIWKKGLGILFVFIAIIMVDAKIKAFNYKTSEMRVYSLAVGKKICVRSDVFKQVNAYNVYIWTSFNNNKPLAEWPGVAMQEEGEDIYCYTHTDDSEAYNYVIFNGGGKQTVDLSLIDDKEQLIDTFLYQFDDSHMIGGKYIGEWYVYDTSELVEIVNTAKALDGKKYTINSYNNVLAALGNGTDDSKADYISKATIDNDPSDNLTIRYENNVYSSDYIDAYNSLAIAMNNLVERMKISVNNSITGGTLSADYVNNSDNSISITPSANMGYELKKLTAKKIVSYDSDNNPVYGDETNIDISGGADTYNYSFDESEYGQNNMVGLYFDAQFAKKTFKIRFIVGANGKITTLDDADVPSPVTVEYNDDYSIKIKANKGYEIDKILINGQEYHLTDGVLVVKNVKEDTEVEISFKLKSYNIKVDGTNYKFAYNTTYNQIIEYLNLSNNEDFLYLKDKEGKKLTDEYKVEKDDELTVVYKDKKEDGKKQEDNSSSKDVSDNPLTRDNIVKSVVLSILSLNCVLLIISILLKRGSRKNI